MVAGWPEADRRTRDYRRAAREAAQDAMIFVPELFDATGRFVPRMDVARALTLRCRPNLLCNFAPPDVQLRSSGRANRVGQRTIAPGFLGTVLSDVASRTMVRVM